MNERDPKTDPRPDDVVVMSHEEMMNFGRSSFCEGLNAAAQIAATIANNLPERADMPMPELEPGQLIDQEQLRHYVAKAFEALASTVRMKSDRFRDSGPPPYDPTNEEKKEFS